MIRITSLLGARVVTADGAKVGRVEEVHADDKGVVTALTLGARGWIERHGGASKPKRIGWDEVAELDEKRILLRKKGDK